MNRYGIFIEPQGDLRKYILQKKRDVRERFGWQNYVDHPPHSTLFCGNLSGEPEWLMRLERLGLASFVISCNAVRVFPDDPLCGGTDTLTVEIDSDAARHAQMLIANELKCYTEKSAQHFSNHHMQESWDTYGYQFVGAHWIPHMTIASINAEYSGSYVKEITQTPINFAFECNAISVWKISGDTHTKIKDILLT